MSNEMSPVTDNVIRFPVEMREKPSFRLLFQLQPDVRTLFLHAEWLGFELPQHDLRDRTDAATAEYIAGHLDGDGRAPRPFLDALVYVMLERALEAARCAVFAAEAATTAQGRTERSYASDTEKQRAVVAMTHSVRLGLEVHVLCEEVTGVERAVGFARLGEPWVPRDNGVDVDILLAAEIARQSAK